MDLESSSKASAGMDLESRGPWLVADADSEPRVVTKSRPGSSWLAARSYCNTSWLAAKSSCHCRPCNCNCWLISTIGRYFLILVIAFILVSTIGMGGSVAWQKVQRLWGNGAEQGETEKFQCSTMACPRVCRCTVKKCAVPWNLCANDPDCAELKECISSCPCGNRACSIGCGLKSPAALFSGHAKALLACADSSGCSSV